jgi:hypothetical protein
MTDSKPRARKPTYCGRPSTSRGVLSERKHLVATEWTALTQGCRTPEVDAVLGLSSLGSRLEHSIHRYLRSRYLRCVFNSILCIHR